MIFVIEALLLLAILLTGNLYSSREIMTHQFINQVLNDTNEQNIVDRRLFRHQKRANFMLFISAICGSLCYPYTLSYLGPFNHTGVDLDTYHNSQSK